jgi:hypothetical protein
MRLGDVIYESGGALEHVYFPTDCIISLPYVMEDGASADVQILANKSGARLI